MAILRNIKNPFLSIIACIRHSDSPLPSPPSSIDLESQQPQPLPSPEVQLASTQLPEAPSSVIDPLSPPRLPPSTVNAASFQPSPTPHSSSINSTGSAEPPASHFTTINPQSQKLPPEPLIAASLTRQRDQQWQSAIISFCLTSAIQISLYKFQQTDESNKLPFSILLLSCANLVTFALLVVAKLLSENRLTTISKALQEVTIILAFAQLCYTVAIPFTLALKYAVWAIFAISIIGVIILKYLFHF